MTEPATPTPAEAAVEYLKTQLPGFAAMFDASTDTFRVRGGFTFGAAATGDMLTYLAPEDEYARKRYLDALVEKTRRAGIEALGLNELVERELQLARHEASVAAYADGKAAGIAEGRRAMLAELLSIVGEAVDDE